MNSEKSQSISSYAKSKAKSLSIKIFIVGVISVFLIGALIGTYYYRGQLLQTTSVVTRSLSQPMGLGGEFLPAQIINTLVDSGNFKDVWVTTNKKNIHVESHFYDAFPLFSNIKEKSIYWNKGLPHIVITKPISYNQQNVGLLFVGYQIPIITILGFTATVCVLFSLISLYLYSTILGLAKNVTTPFSEYSNFLKDNVGSEYFFNQANKWDSFSEINSFNNILTNYILKAKESEIIARKEISKAQIAKVAFRVKHDVIASLVLGESALELLDQDNEQVERLRTIFERINDTVEDIPKIGSLTEVEIKIAANNENQLDQDLQENSKVRKCHIASFIYQIVGEIKLSKIAHAKKIKFKIYSDNAAYETFSEVTPGKLKRNLLNLYKNAIEAIGEDGIIETKLKLADENLIIEIKDNGRGIPQEVLPLLGKRGATFNKENGTGIGLAATIEDVELWNGNLEIESQENVGTVIRIILPKSEVDYLYPTTLYLAPSMNIIIVDDDPIIHKIWERKFQNEQLSKNSIEIIYFYDLDSAGEHISKLEKNDIDYILLMDNDLRHKELTGLTFVQQQKIESKSILVTTSGNSNWLYDECSKHNLAVIPKPILERIPVQILL
ncbi:MAG: sensor histidine kinase [Bdellovibrionaceae bacterium]|nr:sensor histidine kinase [Pseudobdellovibrionaceae bacterium]